MNVYVRSVSCSIADSSVTTGRITICRGSRMGHLRRALERRRLDQQRIGPQEVVRRLLAERPHLDTRDVARGAPHHRLVAIRQQQDVALRARRLEQPDDRLRLRRSEEHTSELQSRENLVCRLLLEKKE